MFKIHPIQTGKVKVKQFQVMGAKNKLSRLWQLFFTNRWSDWLPIYCWLIEHPHGLFLIDTGEICKVHDKGHLPDNAIFRGGVQYDVKREDEVDRQLMKLGFGVEEVKAVFLTHFHSDHVDGLCHFPNARIYVSKAAYDFALGSKGEKAGYFRKNLPSWFQPETFEFDDGKEGGFETSKQFLEDGSIIAVPLPGHSIGHTGYIVKTKTHRYLFSGDATYDGATLQDAVPFVILDNAQAKQSVKKLRKYAQSSDVLVLCSHDPNVVQNIAL
ncbi:MAG: N-acyl homoserine lactonase family protein [Desulfobacteraceae bacterium]|nr:N-acyl homoserine lactonase family protein [Desulfobacteraceae bacterium]